MKKLALLSILLTLLLMACGTNNASETSDEVAQADTANTEVDQASETDTNDAGDTVATATDTPVSESTAAEAPATTPSDAEAAALASCNVDPLGLPKNEAIANISSVDWLKNEAATDTITIVEYGDFQ